MKTTTHSPLKHQAKWPTKAAIVRAVASSTAIETGQRISHSESKLRAADSKYRHLTLAR